MITRILRMLFTLLLTSVLFCGSSAPESDLYGPVSAADYLAGRFDPAKHPLFVDLSTLKIPTDEKKHYLRKEAALALRDLVAAFIKEHPGIELFVMSSTRSFRDQKKIWDDKWSGSALVNGIDLSKTVRNPRARALVILKYSSMPGTSRHHWGTDFDINSLANSYYEKGDGKILFAWMRAHAARFGFCMPYTAGRKVGYLEERWHWSYVPLSKQFTHDWLGLYGKGVIRGSENQFSGSESCGDLASQYVSSIAEDCR